MTILTKLLPDRPREMGMPRGAGPEITSTDVALAVSQLEPFQSDILLARHIGQEPEDLERILLEVQNSIVRSWLKGSGGASMKRKYIRPMAECCWAEFSSAKKMSHEQRAFNVGIGTASWHESGYKYIYGDAFVFLSDVEASAYRKVKRVVGMEKHIDSQC